MPKNKRLPGILDEWDIFKISSPSSSVGSARVSFEEPFEAQATSTGTQVQEKKLERSVRLRKERILNKRIRNGSVAVKEVEKEEEKLEKVQEKLEKVQEKLEKAEEFIITPSPSSDHTYAKKTLLQ
ncbi:hypothetical protein ACLKA6_007204 [Drosophila palustris]